MVPVGSKVDPALDIKKPRSSFYGDADRQNWDSCKSDCSHNCLRQELSHTTDDPETFKNAPIAIQIVGRTLEDEAIVGISEIVDRELKKYHQTKS